MLYNGPNKKSVDPRYFLTEAVSNPQVVQLQQALNKYFASPRNKTGVNSLAPAKTNDKGEDGIYGTDTKTGIDLIFKAEKVPG